MPSASGLHPLPDADPLKTAVGAVDGWRVDQGMVPTWLVPPRDNEQRRRGRFKCEMVSSNLGPVTDISATGARILTQRRSAAKRGARPLLKIRSLCGTDTFRAEVVWSRKLSFFWREVGLKFLEPSEVQQERLNEILRVSFRGRFLTPRDTDAA